MIRRGSFYRRLVLISIAIISIYFVTITTFQIAFGTSTPFMVVVSNSMYPTLKINDIIVVKSVSIDEVNIGDVIVFRSPLNPRTPIVHRVMDIVVDEQGAKMIITKGDRNPAPDPWTITEDLLIGKVVYVIPQIGAIPKVLNTYPTLKYALAITIIAIIVISEYIDYRRSHVEEPENGYGDNQGNTENT